MLSNGVIADSHLQNYNSQQIHGDAPLASPMLPVCM